LLCRVVNKVLVTFPQTQAPSNCPPMTVVGTPLRQEIMAARQRTREEDGTFRLLVVGGSQGSGVLGDVIPAMLCLFSAAERARFVVVHQARANDVEALHATYKELGLAGYKVEAFFSDMPRRYVDAHLVISRGG